MKLSLTIAKEAGENAPIVLRGNYTENIMKAAKMGYDAVEIHVNDPKSLNIDEIQKACEQNDITVSTIGTGMGYTVDGLSFTDPDSSIRHKAVERILEHIIVAKELDAKVIIGSMRGKIPDTKEYGKYEGYALDCFKTVMENAEKQSVIIVIEAINRYETNFVNNVYQGFQFIEKIASHNLKLHIDTFHMNIEERDLEESIKMAGATLGHVHFADSNRWYPGAGHLDFEAIIGALKAIKYNGYIAFECLPFPTQKEAAENSIEKIRSLVRL
ncbi:MAG: sugar phosphate isomerase/epimerase [Thermoanaerobacteraceae bacterium]|nr:sugar phosphate isomerase/epimerase [Thermoanaerobacteraceae bacterium]